MLNVLYNTEYNEKNTKVTWMNKKVAEDAMLINHTRLVSLKRWCFSMLLKISMNASPIFCRRLFHNLGPK